MAQDQDSELWLPGRFTHGGIPESDDKPFRLAAVRPHTVIILNNPLHNKNILIDVCTKARCIVCADGGANELYDLHLAGKEEAICLPNAICGDLDSLQPEVGEHYRNRNVNIVKDPDQYSTDLGKCLKYIEHQLSESEDKRRSRVDVAIFGSLGGRADQAFSQLHHLYTCSRDESSVIGDLYLITAKSVIFLLKEGKNRIHAPVGSTHFTENVGIIPIGRPAVITTHGLEWDVTDWSTEFGAQMSTSNHIRAQIVEVETSERVLFTFEISSKPT